MQTGVSAEKVLKNFSQTNFWMIRCAAQVIPTMAHRTPVKCLKPLTVLLSEAITLNSTLGGQWWATCLSAK